MPAVLASLSDALAATVAQAGTGVVRVEARRGIPASGILWPSDGLIVTAHHVVEQADEAGVGLPDGRSAAWSDGSDLKVGHIVLALGRPGESVRATLGIVSALGQGWVTAAGGRIDRYLQTDVVMYPGFSGGPLVDAQGRVAGLNSSALSRGVSISIPYGTVRRVVEAILSHGRVRRGYLGIGTQPVRLPSGLAQQLGQETGVLIVTVEPGSPAEKSGLLQGDIVVGLGGQAVRHAAGLVATLSSIQPGEASPVRIVRAGQVRDLTVTVGERP
jgi:S1-C subfamily serine protease